MEKGTILYANLGWSAGIPAWYEVIKATAKTVTVRRLADRIVSHDGYGQNGYKMPILGWEHPYDNKPMVRKVTESGSVKVGYSAYAYPWDGEKKAFYTD